MSRTVSVIVSGTPGAVVVELPKLERMSLRTTPHCVSTLAPFDPSPGYGPAVSSGVSVSVPLPDAVVVVVRGRTRPVAAGRAGEAARGERGGAGGAGEQTEQPAAGDERAEVELQAAVVVVVVIVVGGVRVHGSSVRRSSWEPAGSGP